jgi:antitoxin ParD1/3/4
MDISLPPELEQLIQAKVASGRYESVSEVIEEALRLFVEQDDRGRDNLEELRAEIRIGLDQLNRGEAKVYDDESLKDLFTQIKTRGRKRLAHQQDKPAR